MVLYIADIYFCFVICLESTKILMDTPFPIYYEQVSKPTAIHTETTKL